MFNQEIGHKIDFIDDVGWGYGLEQIDFNHEDESIYPEKFHIIGSFLSKAQLAFNKRLPLFIEALNE